jgi:hypothetical protein
VDYRYKVLCRYGTGMERYTLPHQEKTRPESNKVKPNTQMNNKKKLKKIKKKLKKVIKFEKFPQTEKVQTDLKNEQNTNTTCQLHYPKRIRPEPSSLIVENNSGLNRPRAVITNTNSLV